MKDGIRLMGWILCVLSSLNLHGCSKRFNGGTGKPDDPYQIATAEQLISIGSNPHLLDKHFVLINDIDLDPNLPGRRIFKQAVIAPDKSDTIGTNDPMGFHGFIFNGSFNGNEHKIRNLTIRSSTVSCLGLFGYIGPSGRIHNVGLENVLVVGEDDLCEIGTLVGMVAGGTVNSCYTTGKVLCGNRSRNIGGLVGSMGPGSISNCYTIVNVYCKDSSIGLGGLVGNAPAGRITNCYANGSVSGRINTYVLGGLVGGNGSVVTNCYAAGTVSGGQDANNIGGLIGHNRGHVINCYFLSPSSGGGPDNGTGLPLTDEQMKQPTSFRGWGFDNIWVINKGEGYPLLRPGLPEPPLPSPPDFSHCTRIKILYGSTMWDYIRRAKGSILSLEEKLYLESLEITLDDPEDIKAFARDVSLGQYSGTGGAIGARLVCYVDGYCNGDRLISITVFEYTVGTKEGHWFDYPDGFLQSLDKYEGKKPSPQQILPFDLRVRCAMNLERLHTDLKSYLEDKKKYPPASKWCDVLSQGIPVPGPSGGTYIQSFGEWFLVCPNEPEGKCHYAINPNCRPDSLPDTVLLFETKDGWNQHGGPELFTFDNHNPKGGCVLLNDGTIKFIHTKEELQQLRWK